MDHHSTPGRSSRLPIYLLSTAGFTILTTEFVIIGLLPPMAKDLGVSVSQAGLLVTLFAVTVGVVGPLLTAALARYERKTLFVATLLVFAFSNFLAAAAPSIGIMAVARFIPALLLPVFWALASETAMRIMGPEHTGKAVAMVNYGIVAAMIFGIPVGTLISDRFGWRTAFAVIAALALTKAALLFIFLPTIQGNQERVPVWRQMRILREPKVSGHVLLSLLVYAGMFTAYTYLAAILEELGGFNGAAVGWILMGFGCVGLLGNWLGGLFVDRHPLRASILFCVPLAICLLLLTHVIRSPIGLTLVLAAWGISHAALFTVSHTRVVKAAERAPALGASLNVSGANFGIALGALLGTRVVDLAGLEKVSVAAGAIVALAIAPAAFSYHIKKPGDPHRKSQSKTHLKLRHLGWAGVEIDHDGHTLIIDCLKDSFRRLIPGDKLVSPLGPGRAAAALVTHLHSDHADPVAIAAALAAGAPVFRPEPNPGSGDDLILTQEAEAQFREVGLEPEIVQPWEERRVGPFRIIAAPSVDGFGDPQRCWIVEAGGTRILHAGDTLFHGYWWAIARAVGPIDVAFLPINGPKIQIPFVQPPSPLPAAMLPEEAAVAAHILRARIGVPIHYELLNQPPEYTETPRPAERFSEKARELGVRPLIATRGEWFSPE